MAFTGRYPEKVNKLVIVGSEEGLASGVFTPDLRYVAFSSFSPNLVPNDTNGVTDVFVTDRAIRRGVGRTGSGEPLRAR